jgi:hypothetical protein
MFLAISISSFLFALEVDRGTWIIFITFSGNRDSRLLECTDRTNLECVVMAAFKKTNVKIYAKTGPNVTPDTLYWKKLGVCTF